MCGYPGNSVAETENRTPSAPQDCEVVEDLECTNEPQVNLLFFLLSLHCMKVQRNSFCVTDVFTTHPEPFKCCGEQQNGADITSPFPTFAGERPW